MISPVIIQMTAMRCCRHASAEMGIYAWLAIATAVLGIVGSLVFLGLVIREEFRK